MAAGVFIILWNTIPPDQILFPSSDTLTGMNVNPAAGTVITITNIAGSRYINNPLFAGITIQSNGLSGGITSTLVCLESEIAGKKIKLYISFASTYYALEAQVWGAGCWQLQNLVSDPASTNTITYVDPLDIFEDFDPNERDPAHSSPTNNPFIPWLIIIETIPGECALVELVRVTINQIALVNIISAIVYKDGINTGVTLAQLAAGYIFTSPGNYSVVIVYRLLVNATTPPASADETLTQNFTISETPFPYTKRESLVYGYISPGEPVLLDTLVMDNGTINYTHTGSTTDGVKFTIAVNGSTNVIGSSHVKISHTKGSSIVKVNASPPIIQLISVSDGLFFYQRRHKWLKEPLYSRLETKYRWPQFQIMLWKEDRNGFFYRTSKTITG